MSAKAGEDGLELSAQARRIYAFARPYAGRIALSLLMIMIATAIGLLLPLGIKQLFDQMLAERDTAAIHLVTLALLGIFVLRAVFSFIGQFRLQLVGDSVVAELRIRVFEHLHTLGLDYHIQQRIGDLLSRLGNDVAAVRNIVANLSVYVVINLFQFVGAAVVMLGMNWRMGLLVLAVTPLTTVVTRGFGPVLRRLSAKIQDELAHSTTIAQESLTGIELIKAYARAPREAQRYRSGMNRYLAVVLSARRTDAFFNALISLLTASSTIAIFWYGGLQVMAGRLSAGSLVAFLLYSQNITQSIVTLSQQYSSFSQAAGASKRVFEILDIEPSLRERDDALELRSERAVVEFDGVDFAYRADEPVLTGIQLRAEPGQTVALVGHSGAGKSTLIRLIPRLYDVGAGAVRINGRDVRDYTLESLRQSVAMVSQDVFLFGTSVRENIRYGRLDASDEEVEAAARAAHAHEFIERLREGYDTQIGERGLQLSGGQRQRISIARALLKDAPILLLDEATSAVDGAAEALIQQAIERLKRQRTTFVVAHRQATVRNADVILVLEHGRIVERPSYAEFIARDHGLAVALHTRQNPQPAAEPGRESGMGSRESQPPAPTRTAFSIPDSRLPIPRSTMVE
ncbi:ABC transporter, ATP-binding protein [Lysobacter capsici AZ78]|uniref:ABC transporter, ATP-binding protein n=1 Tax=Lysobacter capsici AZ78 TaxID=1444315 RepID=A0A108U687_9GAMM|nr:ABC transporter ATP-binding protein [Lysobacter capsici]KWS03302.1 ABC transporter, ATP-binding protein [Lysobacter capsici AZ78]